MFLVLTWLQRRSSPERPSSTLTVRRRAAPRAAGSSFTHQLKKTSDASAPIREVHRLENEGDRVSRDAIASLFQGGIDPMVVIRWKDIFTRLEQAIDACERVADVIDAIIIKNA